MADVPTDELFLGKKQKVDGSEDPSTRDSVDTEAMQAFTDQALSNAGRSTEQRDAAAVFGQTQGPAGSVVPVALSASEAETGLSEEQPSELEPGIVTIEDRTPAGDQAGADAALRAANKARMRGSSDDAVLDALEAAETAYDSHCAPEPVGSMTRRLSSKMESGEKHQSPSAGNGRNGGRKGFRVDESVRQKVRLKFVGAMQKNAALAVLSPEEAEERATQLEQACLSSSSSRPVYNSKAGNMSRLLGKALQVAELEELPRIASGLQKEVAQGAVARALHVRESTTGLQGIAMK